MELLAFSPTCPFTVKFKKGKWQLMEYLILGIMVYIAAVITLVYCKMGREFNKCGSPVVLTKTEALQAGQTIPFRYANNYDMSRASYEAEKLSRLQKTRFSPLGGE